MNRVFLGGTLNDSTWRKEIKAKIKMDYFDPVVDDWTEDCQRIEINEKENGCNIHLYVITSQMTGVFSIAEVIDSVHNSKKRTILHVIPKGFIRSQLNSLRAVINLVRMRGGDAYISNDLYATILLLNSIKDNE